MEFIKIIDSVDNGLTYNARYLPEKYNKPIYNKFFNFAIKHYSITNRMIYLNSKINELWKEWEQSINEPHINTNDKTSLINSAILHKKWEENLINSYYSKEEFIACLRKVVDECLILFCVATQKFKNNGVPIDSIGEYLSKKIKKPDSIVRAFTAFTDFFVLLNDISNSYKHAIINCQFVIDKEAPGFDVYKTKHNQIDYHQGIHISLDEIIKKFNVFYNYFDKAIKNV